MPAQQVGLTPQFRAEMACCKASRESAGFVCDRPRQMCCAWYRIEDLADGKGDGRAWKMLQAFAGHLLGECAWSLSDVVWAFLAAGQISALADFCARRWQSMPAEARAAYAAEVAAAAVRYRAEVRPLVAGAFLSTFNALCQAASARP